MGNKWYIYCKKGDFAAISKKFNISPMLARILINRGLETDEDIDGFLNAGLESLHDPFLMKDMDKGVALVIKAVADGGRIRIIGDYDVDGICASYILKKYFDFIGASSDVRLPNRVFDGYGMNESMADDAHVDGISLIITCDNGVSSYDAVKRAEELGIEVIITDHHSIPEVLPPAQAIIDAKQDDCNYPYKELCGAAVAYKFITAVNTKISEQIGELLPANIDKESVNSLFDELIQYVGMATIADIVPLQGENRIFAKEGIRRLRETNNPGLSALIDIKGIERSRLKAFHVGFIIGPCLNSAGRLKDAQIAFDLLDAEDRETAFRLASGLSELNEERKGITQCQIDTAQSMINKRVEKEKNLPAVLVIYLPEAHESVAGIVAGKLKDTYNRPAIVLTDSEEGLKGSGRSVDGYNMIDALQRHSELFKKFGGHAKAAGFTLNCPPSELDSILNADNILAGVDFEKKTWIDMQLPFNYITEEFIEEINLLEPYGFDNAKPLFAEKDVRLSGFKLLGKNSNVLKMTMVNALDDKLEGVIFGHGRSLEEMKNKLESQAADNKLFSVIYHPVINEFKKFRYLQAIINEIRLT